MTRRHGVPDAMGLGTIAISIIAMVATIGAALLLIEQLSLRAAIRGGLIAISALLGTQIGLRLYARWQRRHDT